MQEQLRLTYSNQITAVLIFDLYTSVFALPTDILYYNYLKLIWTNTTIIYSYTVQYKTCIAYIRRCESKQISKISLKCSKWKTSLKWWNTNTRCPATHVKTSLCWEPRTSVLNMTLTAIQLQPQLGRFQLLIDICCSCSGCSKRQMSIDGTDRQTDGHLTVTLIMQRIPRGQRITNKVYAAIVRYLFPSSTPNIEINNIIKPNLSAHVRPFCAINALCWST